MPWKYGFKGIKSIVSIKLTRERPPTTWNLAAPDEYGFYANVNPHVDHPRFPSVCRRSRHVLPRCLIRPRRTLLRLRLPGWGRLSCRGSHSAHQLLDLLLTQLGSAGGRLRLYLFFRFSSLALPITQIYAKSGDQLPGQVHRHDIDEFTFQHILNAQHELGHYHHPAVILEVFPLKLIQVIQSEGLGRRDIDGAA